MKLVSQIGVFVKSNYKYFILFFIASLVIPRQIFNNPGVGLDPSWQIAINLAIKENLKYGEDFIFTYGPWGFLSTSLPQFVSSYSIVAFFLFICFNASLFLLMLCKECKDVNDLIKYSVLILFGGWFLFRHDTITLYFFSLFQLMHYSTKKNNLSIAVFFINSLLSFFIKVNVGFVLIMLFYSFIILNIFLKKIKKLNGIIIILSHIFSIIISSLFFNVDLWGYFKNSIPIIDSYNDAMNTIPYADHLFFGVVVSITLTLVLLYSLFKNKFYLERVFIFINSVLFMFIFFKQCFVRGDDHVFVYFAGIGFFGIVINEYFIKNNQFRNIGITAILIVSLITFNRPYFHYIKSITERFDFASIIEKKVDKKNMNRNLPKKFIDKIKNKSVDVFGYETSYIYYNNLKYNPRPIIQSYSAYDDRLISLNSKKYSSNDGPDFIIYHYGTIDNRQPLGDEPKTVVSILENYSVVDSFQCTNEMNSLILLSKNSIKKRTSKYLKRKGSKLLNDTISLGDTKNILMVELEFEYTRLGMLRRFFFQPAIPFINLYSNTPDSIYTYRLVIPVAKSGMILNKKVSGFEDAYGFFESGGQKNTNQTHFNVVGNPRWIKREYTFRIYEDIIE